MTDKSRSKRIATYLTNRAINPREVSRQMYRQVGKMVPLTDVIAVCSMILSGEIDSFMDHFDEMVPMEQRTTTTIRNSLFGTYRCPPPPPPLNDKFVHRPMFDNTNEKPHSGKPGVK